MFRNLSIGVACSASGFLCAVNDFLIVGFLQCGFALSLLVAGLWFGVFGVNPPKAINAREHNINVYATGFVGAIVLLLFGWSWLFLVPLALDLLQGNGYHLHHIVASQRLYMTIEGIALLACAVVVINVAGFRVLRTISRCAPPSTTGSNNNSNEGKLERG